MEISDQKYLFWNKKLLEKKFFSKFFIFWGIYSVIFFGFAGLYLFLEQGMRPIWLIFIAAIFAHFVVCKLTHFIYKKAHPYQRLNFLPPTSFLFSWSDNELDSFPSEHSATAAAIATILYYFNPDLGLSIFGITFVMSISRIILGYHDFLDVLAGWLLGILSGILVLFITFGLIIK